MESYSRGGFTAGMPFWSKSWCGEVRSRLCHQILTRILPIVGVEKVTDNGTNRLQDQMRVRTLFLNYMYMFYTWETPQ